MGETHVKVKDKTLPSKFCSGGLEEMSTLFPTWLKKRGACVRSNMGMIKVKKKNGRRGGRVDKSQWFPMFIAFSLSVVLMHHNLFITICIGIVVGFPEKNDFLVVRTSDVLITDAKFCILSTRWA